MGLYIDIEKTLLENSSPATMYIYFINGILIHPLTREASTLTLMHDWGHFWPHAFFLKLKYILTLLKKKLLV